MGKLYIHLYVRTYEYDRSSFIKLIMFPESTRYARVRSSTVVRVTKTLTRMPCVQCRIVKFDNSITLN